MWVVLYWTLFPLCPTGDKLPLHAAVEAAPGNGIFAALFVKFSPGITVIKKL
jgi:hypothetical protein